MLFYARQLYGNRDSFKLTLAGGELSVETRTVKCGREGRGSQPAVDVFSRCQKLLYGNRGQPKLTSAKGEKLVETRGIETRREG